MEVEKEPLVIIDKNKMSQWSTTMRAQDKTIGLVPTMGYLHEGHLSLIRESHTHTHLTVVSIYVSPGQFSPSEGLSTYPSNFNGDIKKLKSSPGGVDVVFHPYNLYDYGGGGVEREVTREKEVGGAVVSCVEVLRGWLPGSCNTKSRARAQELLLDLEPWQPPPPLPLSSEVMGPNLDPSSSSEVMGLNLDQDFVDGLGRLMHAWAHSRSNRLPIFEEISSFRDQLAC